MGQAAPIPSGGNLNAGNSAGGLGDILGGLLGGKPGATAPGAKPSGGLGNLLPGGLGGLLGGAAAGSVLSGGLGNLIKELQDGGHARVAQSWVGTGANEEIAPNDLAHALGDDTLASLSQQTGMGREDLLAGLSQHLPDLINQLTPHGRLPSEEEALFNCLVGSCEAEARPSTLVTPPEAERRAGIVRRGRVGRISRNRRNTTHSRSKKGAAVSNAAPPMIPSTLSFFI